MLSGKIDFPSGRRDSTLGAAFYLLLSGAEVATQRSFYITGVVLISAIVDRRAITFRTLALAAMIVLLLASELGNSRTSKRATRARLVRVATDCHFQRRVPTGSNSPASCRVSESIRKRFESPIRASILPDHKRHRLPIRR